MSLLVIMSVFMAVFLMLARLLTESIIPFLFGWATSAPVITRALPNNYWYSDQNVCVSWNGQFSNKFSVSNGVRQGGVLSPILFTVYVDDLLTELEKKGVGCYWNNHFVGGLCYADDIALLAPSPTALHLMLDTCSSFASS